MHSFYFGSSENPLYGVSHSPTGNDYRDTAVLICNSVGHEHIRSYKELKKMADKLSAMGYYVLRFDYKGVGDSSGEFHDASLSDWKNDIKLAADELKAISGQDRVTVIGLRLGATMSLLLSEQYSFNNIILWDMVVSGQQYINNLKSLQKKLLVDRMWFSEDRSTNELLKNEYIGYQYSESILKELSRIDFFKTKVPEYQLLKTVNTNASNTENLDVVLKDRLDDYESKYINDIGNWEELSFIDSSLTSTKIISHICELLK